MAIGCRLHESHVNTYNQNNINNKVGVRGQNCCQCLVITLAAIALILFVLLQARFMKLMNEKAALIERIQELEHVTVQLSMETETIGKY